MKYYSVPEDYIKKLIKDSKILKCLKDDKILIFDDSYANMLLEKESYIDDCSELSEFSCIESTEDYEYYEDEDEE